MSIDLQVAVTRAATVHYVVVPAGIGGADASAIVEASGGLLRGNTLEQATVACGQVPILQANTNTTLSIVSLANTSECVQLGAQQLSCARCPFLAASTAYSVILVPSSIGFLGNPARLEVATSSAWVSSSPAVARRRESNATDTMVSAQVAPAGENAFSLSFSLDRPGTLNFLVLYSSMIARYVDTYIVFDNSGPSEPTTLMSSDLAAFSGGVVARGSCTATHPGVTTSCRIGPLATGDAAESFECSPTASCTVQNNCFGTLCDYSQYGIIPNSTYKVVVFPDSADGGALGVPRAAGSFRTTPSRSAPQPSDALRINPVVGPDRFTINSVSQDKPGLAYVIVTRPGNQQSARKALLSGTTTNFIKVATTHRRARQLLQSVNLTVLPAENGVLAAGASFLPSCPALLPCRTSLAINEYVSPDAETLVTSQCMPVQRINDATSVLVSALSNDTVYCVRLVTSDVVGNLAAWSALVHTQDLTPPALTLLGAPPPSFTSFALSLTLDEPGTIFVGLALAASSPAPHVACPPEFTAPLVTQSTASVEAAGANVTTYFSQGLTANTDYAVYLIARDMAGNCQEAFTVVNVHTADNNPPITLDLDVADITGSTASLHVRLDEPGTAFFVLNATSDSCPAAADIFTLVTSGGQEAALNASGVGDQAGQFDVADSAPATAAYLLEALLSETTYTACVVAQDTTQLHNRQTSAKRVRFTTLDITPPVMAVDILRSKSDNADAACSRAPPYLCNATWTVTLSEPGAACWVLVQNGSSDCTLPALLPSPAAMLSQPLAAFLSDQAKAGCVLAAGNISFPPSTSAPVQVVGMPSKSAYALLLAPRDDAVPSPNLPAALTMVNLVAPDVEPPHFLETKLAMAADTSLRFTLRLDESGATYYILHSSPSATPSVSQVLEGKMINSNGTAPVASGNLSNPVENASVELSLAGLEAGQLYDLHLVAVDTSGNQQPAVTSLRGMRTTDSVPPSFVSLAATWTPPMTLALAANVSKPGTVRYLAQRKGQPAPSSVQTLLYAVTANNLAQANFTGNLAVGTAYAIAGSMSCVADGDQMVLYAVAQDREGTFPGRWPNNSTMVSVPVRVVAPAATTSCEPSQFMSVLRPTIGFDPTGPGFPLGSISSSLDTAQRTTWSQTAGAFSSQQPPQPAKVLVRAGGVALEGAFTITVPRNPPSSASVVACSQELVPEVNSMAGQTLRLSFQLKDYRGRTAVDTTRLELRPLLSYVYAANIAQGHLHGGVNTTTPNELPRCEATSVDPVSGIGECSVLVADDYFPAAGRIAATVVLQIRIGDSIVGLSSPASLVLRAPPARPPFTTSTPAILLTMPARPVFTGETFVVTVVAANPLPLGLRGWGIPVRYSNLALELTSVKQSSLWLPALTSDAAVLGSNTLRNITVTGRSAGQPSASFRSSSSIPLVELSFIVRATVPGTYPGVVSLTGGTTLSPSWAALPAVFYDYRDGPQGSGSVNVTATRSLGLWAWAERGDIFNSARFTAERTIVPLHAASVRAWGTPTAAHVAPSTCTFAASNSSGASDFMTTASLDGVRCVVNIDAYSTAPIKDTAFSLGYGGSSATAVISVWQPSHTTVLVNDETLNSVLPVNAAPPSPGCTDMYQASRLRAVANWTNGGGGPDDWVVNADVTELTTFTSNDTNIALVQGPQVRGISPGAASVGLATFTPASTTAAVVTVTNTPACLMSLQALATTGVEFVSPSEVELPGSTTELSWRAAQDLSWEGATAEVLTYAVFGDGSAMDVSSRATVALARGTEDSSLGSTPFELEFDASGSPVVRVNASVSGSGVVSRCGAYLAASWEVCSRPLGNGQGNLVLALPTPLAVANISAQPSVITTASDPAALPPMLLPTASALRVSVAFSDGSLRDFSLDPRTSFTGATLCTVSKEDGTWLVTSTAGPGSSTGDSCTLTANVRFGNDSLPLSSTVTVGVVTLRSILLYGLPPDALAPPDLPPPVPPLGTTLRLLRCDQRNYDQLTLWAMAVLSSCSNLPSSCPLSDINNRQWIAMGSSNSSVFDVMKGYPSDPDYATFPLMDNRLVPVAPGTANLSLDLGNTTTRVAITVLDTYQPTWPRSAPASDTTINITANMTTDYSIMFRAMPSSSLDLFGTPPSSSDVEGSGAVTLVASPDRGPGFYAATASGLSSGTNYTVLLAVRSGLALSSGVTAISGVLVPDTQPPSFTVAQLAKQAANTSSGAFSVALDLGVDETGVVSFAVYGDPDCITADPTTVELEAGMNLHDAGKCTCGSRFCGPVARGQLRFSNGSRLRDVISISGVLPPNPYDSLRDATSNALVCAQQWVPSSYASRTHSLYLMAEDDLPTYKGWTSSCAAPPYDQSTPPSPCAPVTVVPCNNTPPARESNNQQALPFAAWDITATNSRTPPKPPSFRPLRAPFVVSDPQGIEFRVATLTSVGSGAERSLIFTFAVSRPSLVRYQLVRNVVDVLAWGMFPVFDTFQSYNMSISRDCAGVQLVPGTAYGLWHNATDVYGAASPLRMLSAVLSGD